MLEKKIRRSIIEAKEQKEKRLIKESLIKNRLSVLVEHIQSEEDFNKILNLMNNQEPYPDEMFEEEE